MTAAVAERLRTAELKISTRPAPGSPVFVAAGRDRIGVLAGTVLIDEEAGTEYSGQTEIACAFALEPGQDYVIVAAGGALRVESWESSAGLPVFGGFHFAPGGNAAARAGGDDLPAINPCSIWDIGFRPACADPRGMAYVAGVPGSEAVAPFWAYIYLTAADHLALGTSVSDVAIADGRDLPQQVSGKGRTAKFDFETAKAVLAHHGKQLMSFVEFAAAAYGVMEKSARGNDPKVTGLDAPRTSRAGLMQAAGNLWVWGHDGDPDDPRACRFGGRWDDGGYAGSRYAFVVYWPDYSREWIGARGRSDHLIT